MVRRREKGRRSGRSTVASALMVSALIVALAVLLAAPASGGERFRQCGEYPSPWIGTPVSGVPCRGPQATGRLATMAKHRAAKDGPIYFWANLGASISPPDKFLPNPFVARPRTFVIFEDGSFQIEKLHWTGWGSSVARAIGKSNSDNDKPNVAEGKHTITWAKVSLYNPGVFHSKKIYRCIRIKVPPPAHVGPSCLQRTVGGVALLPPGSGAPVGLPGESSNARLTQFLSPDRHVSCYVGSSPSAASCYAFLERGPNGSGSTGSSSTRSRT